MSLSEEERMHNDKHICPVCGFAGLMEEPHDSYGCTSFEICPCCGFEFGYDDEDGGWSYEEWRKAWIAAGFPWMYHDNDKPATWNRDTMMKQTENIRLTTDKPRYVADSKKPRSFVPKQ